MELCVGSRIFFFYAIVIADITSMNDGMMEKWLVFYIICYLFEYNKSCEFENSGEFFYKK